MLFFLMEQHLKWQHHDDNDVDDDDDDSGDHVKVTQKLTNTQRAEQVE